VTPPFLGKRVCYALKCLSCLAQGEQPLRANELARLAAIPPAQAAKILYFLTWGGFVSSRRGSKGGFWLRVPSNQIRIQDVIKFFNPPDAGRPQEAEDSVLQVWREKVGDPRGIFEKLTLADLVRESQKSRSPRKNSSKRRQRTGRGDVWRFFA